jgi:hypothetical protein
MEEQGLNDMQLLEEEEEEEREEREREAAPKPPPSWLLKMIANWGNRWGSRKKADDTETKSPPIVDGDRGTHPSPSSEDGATSPVPKSPSPDSGESVGLSHTHDDQ